MRYSVAQRLIRAVLFAAAASFCVFASAEKEVAQEEETGCDTVLPIVNVFNVSAKLWLYWENVTKENKLSSDERKEYNVPDLDFSESCTFIRKINISKDDFHFWRKTLMLDEMVQSHYYGEFFSEGGNGAFGSMKVTDLSAKPDDSLGEEPSESETERKPFETMKLVFTEGPCSVFFVTPLEEDAETVCQLYQRGSTVSENPPQNCTKYYENHCGNKTAVYKTTCQSEVKEAQKKLKRIIRKS